MPVGFIPQGDEFQVNTETTEYQETPSITALNDGGFVVTWESLFQDGSGYGIYGQRYGADGATIGDEFLVNTETINHQFSPSITALADGGFVVTWESYGNDGSDNGIFGQRYGADGATIGDEFLVNTETSSFQAAPSITALADGGFVVTWQSFGQDGSGYGIYGQRYSADGATVEGEFLVNTETADDQQRPSITALADGGFVVTWESDSQDSSSYGIYGQRYGADGVAVGDEFQVNTETADGQRHPSITALVDGGFVVTWQSLGQEDDSGIYGQRYSADGATVGDEFQVNTETANDQQDLSITALADGGFVVTWESDDQDGSNYGIYGQRYDADGATVGDEFLVNTETTNVQADPSITALANGGFVVTWESLGQDGSGSGIFAQQFAAQLFGTAGNDEITDTVGANWINGLDGDDILNGLEGADTIIGGKGQDIVNGGSGSDTLNGGKGKDTLIGSKGKDVLDGGKGGDTLKGGKGDDILDGGTGKDKLYGGKGEDVFVFAAGDGSDKIFDFKDGKDKLDLSAFDFANKAEAKSHFFERGSASNDVVGFDFDGTNIKIIGLDLGDINNADIII